MNFSRDIKLAPQLGVRHEFLFEFLALWAAKKSGGHPYRLLVLLILVSATVAPILDNVTCVLLVAPVTL